VGREKGLNKLLILIKKLLKFIYRIYSLVGEREISNIFLLWLRVFLNGTVKETSN
jgi:hypothetical protein